VGGGVVGAAEDKSVFAIGEDAEASGFLMDFFDCGEIGLEVSFNSETVGGVLPDVGGLVGWLLGRFDGSVHPVDFCALGAGDFCELQG